MAAPTRLNHYEILEPIGAGGMGEVYVGLDTRLNRKVAVKVLSGLMAADPERRQRFEREARAIAALNHPNIVTIHSVEEADGVPFLTMELVEGRPLADIIPAGGLAVDALLRVGIEISDAVAAAHQKGITHRDLKPANVMVTPEGRVKVLDFGLAKLREAELDGDSATRMPTGDLTGEGRIMGTVAYMSPEQAEGKPVDQRSDIFSIGVMLHEMATGERPFKGDTNVSVISSILKDTPGSITDLKPAVPPGLARTIKRSLAKDPSRRYQTATDLRNELEELKQEAESGATVSLSAPRVSRKPRIGTTVIAAAAAVLILAAAVYGGYRWFGASAASAVPFEIDRFGRLTNSGNALLAAMSADGRYVVHIKNEGLRPGLWVRQAATQSDVQIVPPAHVRYDGVSFSPDGDYVYYVTYGLTAGLGTLYRIPVLGGTAQKVLEDIDSRVTFAPDREQFAFMRGAPNEGRNYVMVAGASGTDVQQVASLEPPDQFQLDAPSWSPDGKTILVSGRSFRDGAHRACFAVDVETRTSRVIGDRWASLHDLEWMPDGRSFIVSAMEMGGQSPQLWQVMYPGGERRRVTNDLNNYIGVSLSADGQSIATVQAENVSNIWVLPTGEPERARQITSGRGRSDGMSGLTWTHDGRIVFTSTASGRPEIWIMDTDGANQRQLTNEAHPVFGPSLAMTSPTLIYLRFDGRNVSIRRRSLDGGDSAEVTSAETIAAAVISPDARSVYYSSLVSGQPRPYRISIDGGQAVALGEVYFRPLDVSSEGRLLLGMGWDEPAQRSSLATLPTEGGSPTLLDLPVFRNAAWMPDGRVAYVDAEGDTLNLWARSLERRGEPTRLAQFEPNVYRFALSADGTRLAVARGEQTTDVVLLTRNGS